MTYRLLFAIFWLLSLLPLGLLHALSYLCYLLVYRVARYRVKLVRKHLADSFPEKGEAERRDIERRFYRHLCDQFVQGIKLMTCSNDFIRRHMRFEGIDLLEAEFAKGKSIALYLGHYGCWDWVTSVCLWLPGDVKCAQIYHTLENPAADRVFYHLRTRFGSVGITMNETLRKLVKYRSEGHRCIVGFIADQVPFWNNIHHWLTFLNHPDTPVLTGTERIVKKLGYSCFYLDITCTARGYYTARFVPLTLDPQSLPDYRVTDLYFEALEQNIRRQPQYWLWTHNRWKRTREMYNKVINPDGTINII